MSKVLHPDVNAASDANDMFIKLGKVKDTLTSESDRKMYESPNEAQNDVVVHIYS